MIREAIILAGGLGTRLRDTVPDIPKCMAPVAGLPFLTYVIRHLLSQGVEHFIFSVGYRHEVVVEYLRSTFPYLKYDCVLEENPLGTGGAIRLALTAFESHDVIIVNGDTLFKADLDALSDQHMKTQAACTLALKPMQLFDRYGSVEINEDHRITQFSEKAFTEQGLINGGVYVLNRASFLNHVWPEVFSFEKDFLEAFVGTAQFTGVRQEAYFIDIGIPEDYHRAQEELKYPALPLHDIDSTWTLFLDRDGVINRNKDESYVFNMDEFIFLDGAKEAISKLSKLFGQIIIITNQRGIGKGLMSDADLAVIHEHMIHEIEQADGRIDAVYYCPVDDAKYPDRKPNPGMLLEASHMYPQINFSKSIMAGDKHSDMQLGRNAGAYTVLITSSQSGDIIHHPDIDISCESLIAFVEKLQVADR